MDQFFRLVMSDKAKDDVKALALTFDAVDLALKIKDCRKTLVQKAAASKLLSSGILWIFPGSNAANASGTGSTAEPAQASGKPGPPLAIDDAQERDRLLRKVEEALKRSYVLSLHLAKVIIQLPASDLASKHKFALGLMNIVVKQQEPLLKHIVIYGPCQATAGPLASTT